MNWLLLDKIFSIMIIIGSAICTLAIGRAIYIIWREIHSTKKYKKRK